MLQETCLAAVHTKLGAKLVDFSGWNMPLHYGSQIEEHHAVRNDAGMFDVSHMTIVDISGADAKRFLRYLLANDVAKLTHPGKALYSAMLNKAGGVIDDLIVYLMPDDGYRLVVNCGTTDKDLAWIDKQAQTFQVAIRVRDDLAMIAVQGPQARSKTHRVLAIPELETLKPFNALPLDKLNKPDWMVAFTGYTGEDGYEIMLPEAQAPAFWQALLEADVKACGLGARDTLRLEAGMNLYGHEMDDEVSPLEANMGWTIAWEPAERDFIGREALEKQRAEGLKYKLVGLVLLDKGVLRAEQEVILPERKERGMITSGTYSPTLGVSIALARVPVTAGQECEVLVRNKNLRAEVRSPVFVRKGQKLP